MVCSACVHTGFSHGVGGPEAGTSRCRHSPSRSARPLAADGRATARLRRGHAGGTTVDSAVTPDGQLRSGCQLRGLPIGERPLITTRPRRGSRREILSSISSTWAHRVGQSRETQAGTAPGSVPAKARTRAAALGTTQTCQAPSLQPIGTQHREGLCTHVLPALHIRGGTWDTDTQTGLVRALLGAPTAFSPPPWPSSPVCCSRLS